MLGKYPSLCTAGVAHLIALLLVGFSTSTVAAQADRVSFSGDLAEVLSARCMNCHGGNRPRRDLRIDSYANLRKGSENGSIIEAGDAKNSLMILKLRGEADGDRMPPSGEPLDEELISRFELWIQQGAKFDGRDPNVALDRLASASRRSRLSAKELVAEAKEHAIRNWRLAFPGHIPETRQTSNFLLLAQPNTVQVESLEKQLEKVLKSATKLLGVPKASLKSPFTIYVLPKRYDHTEFNQMVEKREPVSSHYWRPDGGQGYVVLGPSSAAKGQYVHDALLSGLVGSLLLNRWGAPDWYVDGASLVLQEKLNRRDKRFTTWRQQAGRTLSRTKAKDLLSGRLTSDESDLATWAFSKYLAQDQRRRKRLHHAIASGNSFENAFASIYGGPAEKICTTWLARVRSQRR